jgi:RNA polymerase sigma factor (sigma-70 family)
VRTLITTREFFNTYWRLIYTVACKAGLDESEAQDVVQETVTAVAKGMKEFKYDPNRGSYKGWLKVITKRRVADALRKRYRRGQGKMVSADITSVQEEMAAMQDSEAEVVEELWDDEWQARLLEAAVERVKSRVNPAQFQVFELYELKHCSIAEVTSALKISRVSVYVACHRVKKQLKIEVKRLETSMHPQK